MIAVIFRSKILMNKFNSEKDWSFFFFLTEPVFFSFPFCLSSAFGCDSEHRPVCFLLRSSSERTWQLAAMNSKEQHKRN